MNILSNLPRESFSPESGGKVNPKTAILAMRTHGTIDQVEEIVKSSPSDDNHKRDIYVRFRAAIVVNFVPFAGNSCNRK